MDETSQSSPRRNGTDIFCGLCLGVGHRCDGNLVRAAVAVAKNDSRVTDILGLGLTLISRCSLQNNCDKIIRTLGVP